MPDIVLDYHRLKTPIDHPDSSITRTKLEYPTVNVSFAYLSAINKVRGSSYLGYGHVLITYDSFSDRSVLALVQPNDDAKVFGRLTDRNNMYGGSFLPSATTQDHIIEKVSASTGIALASESVDINYAGKGIRLSCSGSTIKSLRYEYTAPIDPLSPPTPTATITATDTTLTSGYFGFRILRETHPHGGTDSGSVFLLAAATPIPPAQAIIELDFEENGTVEEPFRPSLTRSLVEIKDLSGLPDFLYQEAKKYQILNAKGFTDDEIKLIFGYIPQHQVDLDAITWGLFEFQPDKASSVIVTVTGDNPYRQGAVERQKARSKRTFKPPKDYGEAVILYNTIKRDYPHWMAGKDNFAYQTLGLEIFDLLQNVDSYYGELLEHKTHYDQLKQTPDWEIENRLNELIDKLSRETVLTDERDKHIGKAREILKRGW